MLWQYMVPHFSLTIHNFLKLLLMVSLLSSTWKSWPEKEWSHIQELILPFNVIMILCLCFLKNLNLNKNLYLECFLVHIYFKIIPGIWGRLSIHSTLMCLKFYIIKRLIFIESNYINLLEVCRYIFLKLF